MTSLAAIFLVLLFCGALGGTINHFLSNEEPDKALSAWQHIVVGIGASFMVPLFLNMISSSLVSEVMDSADVAKTSSKLFVLAGFCLVAAVSSRAFISSLSQRILREAREAKVQAEQANAQAEQATAQAAEAKAAVEPLVEPEGVPEAAVEVTAVRARNALHAGPASEDEKKVMRALKNTTFLMRALGGIARQAEIAEVDARRALEALMGRGWVEERRLADGSSKWLLSNEGRSLAGDL